VSDVLAVESAIRQLHARCADAVWRRDTRAFVDCFAQSGEWKIAGLHLRGRAQIGDQFEKFMSPTERVLMSLGVPILQIGQGTASGRTPVTEIVKLVDGRAIRTIGVYYERFVGDGDCWRFSWRHWNLFYYGPPDFSAEFCASPDYGPPPGMPGADDPTLIRGDVRGGSPSGRSGIDAPSRGVTGDPERSAEAGSRGGHPLKAEIENQDEIP
jgi:hypothetical protein